MLIRSSPLPRRLQRIAADPVAGSFGLDVDFVTRPTDRVANVIAIEHPDHGIDSGRPFEHLRPVPLHEAAGDHDPLHVPLVLSFDRFMDRIE